MESVSVFLVRISNAFDEDYTVTLTSLKDLHLVIDKFHSLTDDANSYHHLDIHVEKIDLFTSVFRN